MCKLVLWKKTLLATKAKIVYRLAHISFGASVIPKLIAHPTRNAPLKDVGKMNFHLDMARMTIFRRNVPRVSSVRMRRISVKTYYRSEAPASSIVMVRTTPLGIQELSDFLSI